MTEVSRPPEYARIIFIEVDSWASFVGRNSKQEQQKAENAQRSTPNPPPPLDGLRRGGRSMLKSDSEFDVGCSAFSVRRFSPVARSTINRRRKYRRHGRS